MNEPSGPPASNAVPRERVGVILVHGIGEQRRFQHLEETTRALAEAILGREARGKSGATFEIEGADGASFLAEHDNWTAGGSPAVRAIVRYADPQQRQRETELFFHEVWWADINEQPSFWKQVRFWAWGLAVWLVPGKARSNRPGYSRMRPPFPEGSHWRLGFISRVRLFLAGTVFLLSSLSVTAIVFVLQRLNFKMPDLIGTFVNYMSGVKLYNQPSRAGGSPLDAIYEPPRYTIRRRMVRSLVDVALSDYDRWYVLAHSLGTVVAFNGLMESSQALPNYLDETRWRALRAAGLAGAAIEPGQAGPVDDMMPPRPVWLADNEVVYREKLFARLGGLLTYGSPLDKFAAIWPARVAINIREDVFPEGIQWINVFDPTDPVGANLTAFDAKLGDPNRCLAPKNLGYAASPILLLSHIEYLRTDPGRKDQLADRVVAWLVTGTPFDTRDSGAGWIKPGGWKHQLRRAWAWAQWVGVTVILAYLGAGGVRFFLGDCQKAWCAAAGSAISVLPQLAPGLTGDALRFMMIAAVITFLFGILGRMIVFRKDEDDRPDSQAAGGTPRGIENPET